MNAELRAALERIVGARWVRHRRAELAAYTMDGLPTHEAWPGLVVLPGSPPAQASNAAAAAPQQPPVQQR